ncbi:UPF0496 protein [Acorus calamus]|uniref:UPF0496 protein n=1 Tax=Acorus calamus TaxID=4465 RepID=A0AAV9EDU3_ACOCL|nr:UPF0496 protein [Acorus calamus]
MWATFEASNIAKDPEQTNHQPFNEVNEEYKSILRTDSYAEFLTKAHISSAESLLEPDQDEIPSLLESAIFPDLNALMSNYFEVSAEASRICGDLLRAIQEVNANYLFIQRALEIVGSDSPELVQLALSEFDSFNLLGNPFSDTNRVNFELMHERHSAMLQRLRLEAKKVKTRFKWMRRLREGCKGAFALLELVLAIHGLSGLITGSTLLGFTPGKFKRKRRLSKKCSFLRQFGEQLELAARGTYILNRDFDTLSRLVARLYNEIEHDRVMVLKKGGRGFKKKVKELEEHE